MSRRRRAEKREVLPDPKFGDLVVTKFMNYVMYEGKKAVAENILYGAFDILETKRRDQGPLETFHTALENVSPAIEVPRVAALTHIIDALAFLPGLEAAHWQAPGTRTGT